LFQDMDKPQYINFRNQPDQDEVLRRMETRALIDVATFNETDLTVNITMTTEDAVRMWNWDIGYFNEILQCDKASIRAVRLNNGLPVLDNHNRWDSTTEVVQGIVDSWEAANGRLTGVVKFSDREALKEFVRDVKRGIIRNVSIGYKVYKYQVDTPATETTEGVYRAIDWEPFEVSFVPVPADANATTRNRSAEPNKTPTKNTFIIVDKEGKELSTKSLSTNSNTQINMLTELEIRAAEKQRCIEIHNAVKAAGLDAGEAIKMIDDNKTVEEAALIIKNLLAAKTEGANEAKELTAKEITERNVAIIDAVKKADLPDAFALNLIKENKSVDQARAAIIDEWAKEDPNEGASGHVKTLVTGKDQDEKTMERFSDALLMRSNARGIEFSKDQVDGAREFMGRSFVESIRQYYSLKGVDVRSLSNNEIARKAITDSDLPNVFANTINRSLRAAYQLAPRTFTKWARRTTATDFKPMNRTMMSDLLNGFQEIKPGGEYPANKLSDGKEILQVVKYGDRILITWESIINDDLKAFGRLPQAFAENAAYKQSDLVYAILLLNPVLLTDNLALFHATHNNLVTGPGTDIDATNMGVMRQKLRQQVSPGNKYLNLDASFLIAGPVKETKVLQYTSSQYLPNTQSQVNPWLNLQPIIEPRITGNDWFLLADNGRIDTVEYSFLEGEEEIYTEAKWNFGTDVFEYKGRMEFDAAPIDFRGMVKNTGA
jgi:phage head maturation protease